MNQLLNQFSLLSKQLVDANCKGKYISIGLKKDVKIAKRDKGVTNYIYKLLS